jgi:alpha-galactosidase
MRATNSKKSRENKIVILGAGSIVFTKNLIGDMLSLDALDGSTITLMDIDSHRLELISKLAKRMVTQAGRNIQIVSTLDRREALAGAAYVIITLQVGGLEPFRYDIEIPQRYGVEQCVGDTLGPGGIFRALRTVPVLLDIAKDVEQICPESLVLEYSNPMAINNWALHEATVVSVVGLCHSVPETAERMARFIGARIEDVDYWAAGINHMAWFLEFSWKGTDAYPLLKKAMKNKKIYGEDPIRFDLLKHFGYFVSESSGHASEYYPYFRKSMRLMNEFVKSYTAKDAFWHDWGRTGGYLRYCQKRRDELDSHLMREISGEETVTFQKSNEYAPQIIDSMEGGQPRRIHANVMNAGLISNLPRESCVEVPCFVDRGGVHPCQVGDLPPQLAALCRDAINEQELTVRGCLTGDKKSIYNAVALDPLTSAVLSLDEIHAMVDEMFKEESKWLPRSPFRLRRTSS